MKKFSIAEHMLTVQGEGFFAGTPALFVRLAGCNLWRGTEETRVEDAQRSGAACPMFCDTDFSSRGKLTHDELVNLVRENIKGAPLLVLTGGEPLLQITHELVHDLLEVVPKIAVETNGTQAVDDRMLEAVNCERLWITCSPKIAPPKLVIDPCDVAEIKVVYPAYNPEDYEAWFLGAGRSPGRMFVQPEATPSAELGKSGLTRSNMRQAALFCISRPIWRLSLQTHKIVGLP